MMFVGGVVLMFDGFLVLFLPLIIYGAGVFCSHPNPYLFIGEFVIFQVLTHLVR